MQLGARLVDFAGWEMPILYSGIVDEHHAARRGAAIFDVSHMGRLELWGGDADSLLQQVCTRQLADAVPGQSRYSQVFNPQGGILDDVIVSRYDDHWLMVCNASNREKILAWLQQHAAGRQVEIKDRTQDTMMVAIQGPTVINLLAGKLPIPLESLKRYRFQSGSLMGIAYTLFRSGYTGEDGVEVILPAALGGQIGGLLGLGGDTGGIKPAGLGARDTLRLEAGMPLYGHELSEQRDPISAGLEWCVHLSKECSGVDALRKVKEKGPTRKLVGLVLLGKRIARQHATVFNGDASVGEVTSGTFSPTLEKSIAVAYVDADRAAPGTVLSVETGTKRSDAEVTALPFYKKSS